LSPGSPAIDAAGACGLATDQRGVTRPQGAACDIGAYEFACGNGTVDLGETCDDGNADDGDCCSSACVFDANGAACDDGNACTTGDTCDGAGTCQAGTAATCPACEACDAELGCVAAPRTSCHAPTVRFSGQLAITDEKTDKLGWTWAKGDATTIQEFGDPTTSAPYALCLYDESGATPTVAFRAVTRTGQCGTQPCWKRSGKTAFRYKDPSQTSDGLDALLLKSGAAGKAKILASAKGPNLALPTMPVSLPLRMQLQAPNGACWEASYFALGTSRYDATHFKAKAFVP
jgi:cysteine-rich repeat protein